MLFYSIFNHLNIDLCQIGCRKRNNLCQKMWKNNKRKKKQTSTDFVVFILGK